MDLNADGHIDILSGSYSADGPQMQGLFQVLYGTKEGGYKKATPLVGNDGKSLVISSQPNSADADLDRICTRPTAVDLNGDGHLDIVSGNFGGTFAVFWGTKKGIDPQSHLLKGAAGAQLKVDSHSDPTFADWDGDGDMDLFTGSAAGGAFWIPNIGTKKAPRFGKAIVLVKPQSRNAMMGEPKFGEEHITGPGGMTRITVADVNKDGKLDLLIGDQATIVKPAKGLSEKECLARLKAWEKAMEGAMPKMESPEDMESMTEEEAMALNEKMMALFNQRNEFMSERSTGFVWQLLQK